MFMTILDATIVNVALPTIGRDFGVSATAVDGIAIAFLVSLAVTIPASGWLGDRYGGKRVLLTAIALFTAASALCGLASSLGELVAFRILQGAGGGGVEGGRLGGPRRGREAQGGRGDVRRRGGAAVGNGGGRAGVGRPHGGRAAAAQPPVPLGQRGSWSSPRPPSLAPSMPFRC